MTIRRLSFTQLAGFAAGLFAMQTFWGFTWATLPLYLKKMVDSNMATGILLSIAGCTGVAIPVLSGSLSDKINTRWGRRRPFIAAGLTVVCCMLLLLTRTTSLTVVIPVLVLTFAAFFTALAQYFALLPDIVPVEQRSTASGVMFLVGGVGMLCYLLFAAKRFDVSPSFPFFWAIGGIVISTAIMFVSVKEPRDVAIPSRAGGLAGDILRDRNITRFYSGMILWWTGLWIVSAFFIIAFREVFNVDTQSAVTAFFIFNMSFVAFVFPLGYLGLRYGLKKVTAIGLFILAASLLCTPIIKEYYVALVFIVAAGAGLSSTMAVAYPFFLGLIPKDKTAGFVGIYMACQNGTLLVGPAIGGIVIDCFGYVALFVCSALFIFAGLCVFLTVQSPQTIGSDQIK